jgi:hypothetical protein
VLSELRSEVSMLVPTALPPAELATMPCRHWSCLDPEPAP